MSIFYKIKKAKAFANNTTFNSKYNFSDISAFENEKGIKAFIENLVNKMQTLKFAEQIDFSNTVVDTQTDNSINVYFFFKENETKNDSIKADICLIFKEQKGESIFHKRKKLNYETLKYSKFIKELVNKGEIDINPINTLCEELTEIFY